MTGGQFGTRRWWWWKTGAGWCRLVVQTGGAGGAQVVHRWSPSSVGLEQMVLAQMLDQMLEQMVLEQMVLEQMVLEQMVLEQVQVLAQVL